jgi:hypothetical protein
MGHGCMWPKMVKQRTINPVPFAHIFVAFFYCLFIHPHTHAQGANGPMPSLLSLAPRSHTLITFRGTRIEKATWIEKGPHPCSVSIGTFVEHLQGTIVH